MPGLNALSIFLCNKIMNVQGYKLSSSEKNNHETSRERPTSALHSMFKRGKFLDKQKDTIVISQCGKISEGIRIRLENHFFPNWKQQTLFF